MIPIAQFGETKSPEIVYLNLDSQETIVHRFTEQLVGVRGWPADGLVLAWCGRCGEGGRGGLMTSVTVEVVLWPTVANTNGRRPLQFIPKNLNNQVLELKVL